MRRQEYKADLGELSNIMEFVESFLSEAKLDKASRVRLTLAAEESVVNLINHSDGGIIVLNARKPLLKNPELIFSTKGKAFDFTYDIPGLGTDVEVMGEESEEIIRNIILNSVSQSFEYKNKKGRNIVRIAVGDTGHTTLLMTIIAVVSAIVLGILMNSFLPASACDWINANILSNIQTIFMNGLKMVVAPVVFFSIAGSVSNFSNMTDVGRIGGKVVLFYFVTSVIAVCVGITYFMIFKPGDPSLAATVQIGEAAETTVQAAPSIIGTIVGIVPSNFAKAFVENDMMQLIFLGVVFGLGVSAGGEKTRGIKTFMEGVLEVLLFITGLFVKMVPLIVFCSMLSTMLGVGMRAFVSVLSIFFTIIFGMFTMMVIYCMIQFFIGHLNPLVMLKKYAGTMIQVFGLSSSNASISINMEACDKKLGISPKLYSLSIPLGATLNMDGMCVDVSIFALSLAHIFGTEFGMGELVKLAVTIIIISMGMPGIPGTALIGITMLLSQLNVPVESMGLIMGIFPIVDMFETVNNCLGDVSVTAVVAKMENLLDEKVFYS